MTDYPMGSAGPKAELNPKNVGNLPGSGQPLRAGGKSVESLAQPDENLPSTWSKCAKAQQPGLRVMRDTTAGPECIRKCGTAYLPQDPGESSQAYNDRLARSVFFNVTGETVAGLTGFVFAKDPKIGDDVPPLIVQHMENIDNAGTHFDVFAREQFADVLTAGHNGILVEYPQTGGAQTARDEQTSIRPYWVPILKDNIVSWRTAIVDGKTILAQIVLKECTMVPSGLFGEIEQTRYRVLYKDLDTGVVGVQVLEVNDAKQVTLVSEGTYPTQDEIPFAEIVTSGRKSFLDSKPPLLDLAYLNIAHYQQWSDRATSTHKTCVPIWVESGCDPDDGEKAPIVLGANSARTSTNPAFKAGYQSHDGAALDQVSKVIQEILSDMASFGLAMLAPQKRQAETAEAKRLDKSASDSKLSVAARGLQDGLERALYFHARYLRLNDGGSVEINRDYESSVMTADVMSAYAILADKLSIPVRLILEMLQEGGRISEDENLDELEAQIAANAAAAADQARIEAQANAQAQADAMAQKGQPVAKVA